MPKRQKSMSNSMSNFLKLNSFILLVKNGQKMLKNGQKWSKSVPQRQKSMSNSMSNSVSNFIGQKWTEKAENDSKGTEIGKIDKNRQKSKKSKKSRKST